MEINTVTVIGANGAMGCNVSGIFASFGKATVYMVGRDIEKTVKAAEMAAKSVKAGSIYTNLIPKDYSSLADCIAKSDLVFESVAENIQVKKIITKTIADNLNENAVACTGTSGLSINMLAKVFPEKLRGNYYGVHMFNPPYNMTLCELIPTEYSDEKFTNELKIYLSKVLLRTVITVKDSPAFLANRIGFQFINDAMIFAEKYKNRGGIDYIDAVLGRFTGRSMAPLDTADFVGLDVHEAIVNNICENTLDYAHESFILPSFVQELIKKGHLGRKTNAGLYKKEIDDNNNKRFKVYDIESGMYRSKKVYTFPFAEEMISNFRIGDYKLAFNALLKSDSIESWFCAEFLLKYVTYSLVIVQDVSFEVRSVDDAMATGFNWCPPMAMANAFSQVADFKSLAEERIPDTCKKVDVERIVALLEKSNYDYRRYFRAVK